MEKKFGASDLIEIEIGKLTSEGLQSDQRLAEAFVRARIMRGQGPIKIRHELRHRGVMDQLIESAIDCSGMDWTNLASDVLQRKFGRDSAPDMKEKSRRSRFLQQRGFDFDQIRQVVS